MQGCHTATYSKGSLPYNMVICSNDRPPEYCKHATVLLESAYDMKLRGSYSAKLFNVEQSGARYRDDISSPDSIQLQHKPFRGNCKRGNWSFPSCNCLVLGANRYSGTTSDEVLRHKFRNCCVV